MKEPTVESQRANPADIHIGKPDTTKIDTGSGVLHHPRFAAVNGLKDVAVAIYCPPSKPVDKPNVVGTRTGRWCVRFSPAQSHLRSPGILRASFVNPLLDK